MGNCNTRLLFGGTNTNARRMHAEAPASESAYPAAPLMRSTSSDDSTFIMFENQTDTTVKLYWLNYDGHEVAYRSIAPGRVHRQQTFMTHPWTFKLHDPAGAAKEEDVVVENRRVIFPREEPEAMTQRAVLRKPSVWTWSPQNHLKCFPKDFVESTQSFLLSYNYLSKRRTYTRARRIGDEADHTKVDLGVFPTEIIIRIIELSAPEIPYVLPPPPVEGASQDSSSD